MSPAPNTMSATPLSIIKVSLLFSAPFAVDSVRSIAMSVLLSVTKFDLSCLLFENPMRQRLDLLDSVADCSFNHLAQSHLPFVAAQVERLATYQQNSFQRSVHRLCHEQYIHGVHGVGLNKATRRTGQVFQIGLDHSHRSGF